MRPAVLRRDGHRCRWTDQHGTRCAWADQTGATLAVDHIVRGDDHSMGNLQTLCGRGSEHDHHGTKTSAEAAAARPTRRRPPKPHPGLAG